jgi:transcriptional regulator with XRE-family HTH domain
MKPRELNKEVSQEDILGRFLAKLGIRSAVDFARRIDCSESTVRNWRKGRIATPQLSIAQFKKLAKECQAAGVPIDEIPDTFYLDDFEEDQTESAPTA